MGCDVTLAWALGPSARVDSGVAGARGTVRAPSARGRIFATADDGSNPCVARWAPGATAGTVVAGKDRSGEARHQPIGRGAHDGC